MLCRVWWLVSVPCGKPHRTTLTRPVSNNHNHHNKRSLMSLVGLGSVSTYCTHNLAVPVMVVRPAAAAGSTNGSGAAVADKVREEVCLHCLLFILAADRFVS